MRKVARVSITKGSNNVFADLGFVEPEEELAKANALMLIQQAMRRRQLSLPAAATLMGVSEADVSSMLAGSGWKFTTSHLNEMFSRLKKDAS